MARRKKQQDVDVIPVIVLLVFGLVFAIYQSQYNLILMTSGLLALIAFVGLGMFLIHRRRLERLSRSGIAEIDIMGGIEFERFLQLLLTRRGFTHVTLTNAYDLGVDLVARKSGITWAIQAKRYKGTVGLDAVRQVVAAKNHYKCDKAMVITNSYFTKNAQTIAASTDCLLIDREGLIHLILT